MKYVGNTRRRHGELAKAAVLLINLGTTTAPKAKEVRRFLREFLSDPRVIEIHRFVWWLVLRCFILPFRPRKVAKSYQKVWGDDGSPLLTKSLKLKNALSAALQVNGRERLRCELAMCYGEPSLAKKLLELYTDDVQKILLLPLYPQYSATTTAAAFDAVANIFKTFRFIPEARFINSYHDHPSYISACAETIRNSWSDYGVPQLLLLSFHGLPRRNLLLGDPYYCQCQGAALLIARQLDLREDQWRISFQSRFGTAEWLRPNTEDELKAMPAQGYKNVSVFCPGFAVDCLETLEEIELRAYETFIASGGDTFHYVPALNDSPQHVRALTELIKTHTKGWEKWSCDKEVDAAVAGRLEESRKRALALGASR